jgi:guanylate kinase
MDNKKLVIIGKGGSGKDYLKQKFINKDFLPSVSYTTRPPRTGEINGKDYHFIDHDTFQKMIEEGQFLEYMIFNTNWYYGTPLSEFDSKDVFIMTPEGILNIPKEARKNTMIIYLDIDVEIRRERLTLRKDADDANRRIREDENQFVNFLDYDIRITNHNF